MPTPTPPHWCVAQREGGAETQRGLLGHVDLWSKGHPDHRKKKIFLKVGEGERSGKWSERAALRGVKLSGV